MSDDPAHKAMLYFLEILMNSNGPLTISQLAGRFGSRSFSSEMRSACGGNEAGLKKFLLKYPSLFTVKGNMVSLFDGKSDPEQENLSIPPASNDASLRRRSLPDVTVELQAVSFFQGKLVKKEERWVQIKSLAGHLSQASTEVRNIVGPQLEFRNWLLKHPHIFEVQGELVGLRDGISAMATPAVPQRRSVNFDDQSRKITFDETPKVVKVPPPKTPPPQRKVLPKSPATIRRSRSFSDKQQVSALQSQAPEQIMGQEATSTAARKLKGAPLTMTANEYKAVMFLKEIVEKNPKVKIVEIPSNYENTTDAVRTTIGWTKAEQENFLRKNNSIFVVSEDETISLVKNAKLNVIITGSKPLTHSVRTLNGRKGTIFHVAKLWGIVDLGLHEHVFFDKSIMRRPMDDLTKYFQTGETLYFNAVLAPKSSRAKWRATHVWKEIEQQPSGSESDLSSTDNQPLSPALSVEEEINRFLPKKQHEDGDIGSTLSLEQKYSDAAQSAVGIVPVWNFRDGEQDNQSDKSLTMVPESYQMSESALKDISAADYRNAINAQPRMNGMAVPATESGSKCVEVGCQTVSTGDVIATQLYYEN